MFNAIHDLYNVCIMYVQCINVRPNILDQLNSNSSCTFSNYSIPMSARPLKSAI